MNDFQSLSKKVRSLNGIGVSLDSVSFHASVDVKNNNLHSKSCQKMSKVTPSRLTVGSLATFDILECVCHGGILFTIKDGTSFSTDFILDAADLALELKHTVDKLNPGAKTKLSFSEIQDVVGLLLSSSAKMMERTGMFTEAITKDPASSESFKMQLLKGLQAEVFNHHLDAAADFLYDEENSPLPPSSLFDFTTKSDALKEEAQALLEQIKRAHRASESFILYPVNALGPIDSFNTFLLRAISRQDELGLTVAQIPEGFTAYQRNDFSRLTSDSNQAIVVLPLTDLELLQVDSLFKLHREESRYGALEKAYQSSVALK